MTEFVKLYGSILYSTVWLESLPTKVVWISMLALADWEGLVAASIPGLAKIAGVTREECEAAIATLSAPDIDSKTKTHEGRRILEVDGGWKIINHGKYRDMRTETQVKTAQRVKLHRDKRLALHVTDVTRSNAKKRTVTPVTPDKDKDKDTTTTKDLRTPVVISRYKELFPGSRLSLKSADRAVRKAPQQYSDAELVEALEGNAADPWHVERGKHELSYVLRDEEHIDQFREMRRRQLHPKLVGVGGDVTVEELEQMGIRL